MTRNQGLAIGDSRRAPGIRPGAMTAKPVPQILFAEGGLQAGLSSSPDSASDATRCLVSCSTAQRCRQRQRYLALLLLAMTSYVSGTRRHEITRKPRACFWFLITRVRCPRRPFRLFRYLESQGSALAEWPWLDIRGTCQAPRPSRRYCGGASGVSATCGAADISVSQPHAGALAWSAWSKNGGKVENRRENMGEV